MTKIDKKDIENIETLEKILKSKKLGSIKIKKQDYEIEISSTLSSKKRSETISTNDLQIKNLESIQRDKEKINKENIVSSPMVGVVYLSPDPSSAPFIKEGQHVKQGDILMLIEAMKTFNEIKAPKSGVIQKIIVLNSQPVEFGDDLIVFE